MARIQQLIVGAFCVAAIFAACSNNKGNAPSQQQDAVSVNTDTIENNVGGEYPTAPDFTLNDINGKPLSLSSLKGRYVLLDFWGSWCGWCIKGFPKMKEYYQKYQGRFEILGIDCNDSEERWKAAVSELDLPWLHVYNTKASNILETYGIEGFPTKILVDPDGRIVNVVVGEDPAFYTFLDEMFGK